MADLLAFLQQVVIALAAGALIGIERQFSKHQKIAGLRTFALVSFMGAVSGFIAQSLDQPLILAISYVGMLGFGLLTYHEQAYKKGNFGLTSLVALILTFLIGSAISYGFASEAILVAIALTVVLFQRSYAHRFVSRLTHVEVADALELIIVATIVYYFIPSGPVLLLGHELPLRQLFSFVLFMSLVSFTGFIASRYFKARESMLLSAFTGGMTSGSAFVFKMRDEVKKNHGLASFVPTALFFSFAAAFLRDGLLAAFFSPVFTSYFIPVILVMGLVSLLIARHYYKSAGRDSFKVEFKTPFSVAYASKIAVIFGFVILASDLVKSHFGDLGFLFSSFLLSLASSGAVIANASFLYSTGQVSFPVAATAFVFALVIAVMSDVFFAYSKPTQKLYPALVLYGGLVSLAGVASLIFLLLR